MPRGGKREGAGRPAIGPQKKTISMTLPTELIEKIEAYKKAHNHSDPHNSISRSQTVALLVKRGLQAESIPHRW